MIVSFTKSSPAGISKTPSLNLSELSSNSDLHDTKNKNVYYEGATLSVLNVPILYMPFFSHPDPSVKKRSGLLMPTISSDNVRGDTLSIPIFYNISHY